MTGSLSERAVPRVFWLVAPSVALVTSAVAAWTMAPILGRGGSGDAQAALAGLVYFAAQFAVTLLTGFACVTFAPHLRAVPSLVSFTLAALWFGPAMLLLKISGAPGVVGYVITAIVVARVLQEFRPVVSEASGLSGSLAMALLLQSGAVALAIGYKNVAIVLGGAGSFWMCWKWYRVRHAVPTPRRALLSVCAPALAVVICSLLLSHAHRAVVSQGTAAGDSVEKARGPNLHDGIILHPEHVQQITWLAPLPKTHVRRSGAVTQPKPFHIPFSGEYWFFRAFFGRQRPPPTSLVESGDPTGWNFSGPSLTMKAHQPLGKSIDLACCERIDVALNDADESPGTYALELILVDSQGQGPPKTQTLGAQLVSRQDSESVVRFDMPFRSDIQHFDSMDVLFHLMGPHRNKSANVAIKEFELIPAGR